MKQHQVIGIGLGLCVLMVPTAASAHARAGDESALTLLFHHLLHAVQGPVATGAFHVGLVLALLFFYWKRRDRS